MFPRRLNPDMWKPELEGTLAVIWCGWGLERASSMAKITKQVEVGAGTPPRAAPSPVHWTEQSLLQGKRPVSRLVKLLQASLLMGIALALSLQWVRLWRDSQGSQILCQPLHGLCTICLIADRPCAGRFKAKSRAEGSQKTALSPSAALAQSHLPLSHMAKRRQLGRANVFLFSNMSSSQIGGCAWVAPKDTEIWPQNCFCFPNLGINGKAGNVPLLWPDSVLCN